MQSTNYHGRGHVAYQSNHNMPLQMSSKFLANEKNNLLTQQNKQYVVDPQTLVVGKKINNENIGVNVTKSIKKLENLDKQETRIRSAFSSELSSKKKNREVSNSSIKSNSVKNSSPKQPAPNKQIDEKTSGIKNSKQSSNQANQSKTASAKSQNTLIIDKPQQKSNQHLINIQMPLPNMYQKGIENPAALISVDNQEVRNTKNLRQLPQNTKEGQIQLLSKIKTGQNIVLLSKKHQESSKQRKAKNITNYETQQTFISHSSSSQKLMQKTQNSVDNKAHEDQQQQLPLRSIFSPNRKISQTKNSKTQGSSLKKQSQDKENFQTLSNNKQIKPVKLVQSQSQYSSMPIKAISGDLVQKLKLEVQKQVQRMTDKDNQKQQSSNKKHQSSIISYEARQLMRQNKLKVQQPHTEILIQAQKQKQLEDEQIKKQRQELRNMQDQEMREVRRSATLIQKASSLSPAHKKLKQENLLKGDILNQNGKNMYPLEEAKYASMPLKGMRPNTSQKFIGDNHRPNKIPKPIYKANKDNSSQNKQRGMMLLSDYLKDLKLKKNRDMPFTAQVRGSSAENEKKFLNSNNKINDYLKEQKLKRQNDKQAALEQDNLRLARKQQQLDTLNRIQQIQVEEYKHKIKQQSEKRPTTQKSKTQKKNKKLRHSASQTKRLQLNVMQSGKSMPNLFLSPKNKQSKSIERIQRNFLQSPDNIKFRTNIDEQLRAKYDHFEDQENLEQQNINSNNQNLYQANIAGINLRTNTQKIKQYRDFPLQINEKKKRCILPLNTEFFTNSSAQGKKVLLMALRKQQNVVLQQQLSLKSFRKQENDNILNQFAMMRKELEESVKKEKPSNKNKVTKIKDSQTERNNKNTAVLTNDDKFLNMPLKSSNTVKEIQKVHSEPKIEKQSKPSLLNTNNKQLVGIEVKSNDSVKQSIKLKIMQKLKEIKEGSQKIHEEGVLQLEGQLKIKINKPNQQDSNRQISATNQQQQVLQENHKLEQVTDPVHDNQFGIQKSKSNITSLQKSNKFKTKPDQAKQKEYSAILIQKIIKGFIVRQNVIRLKDQIRQQPQINIISYEESKQIGQNEEIKDVLISHNMHTYNLNELRQSLTSSIYRGDQPYQESLLAASSVSSPFDQRNLQNALYKYADQETRIIEQQYSVFKTPSIQQSVSVSIIDTQGKPMSSYQPIQLFKEQQQQELKQVNEETNIKIFSPVQISQDRIMNNNESFSNQDQSQNSGRSKSPLQEDLPFTYGIQGNNLKTTSNNLNSEYQQDEDDIKISPIKRCTEEFTAEGIQADFSQDSFDNYKSNRSIIKPEQLIPQELEGLTDTKHDQSIIQQPIIPPSHIFNYDTIGNVANNFDNKLHQLGLQAQSDNKIQDEEIYSKDQQADQISKSPLQVESVIPSFDVTPNNGSLQQYKESIVEATTESVGNVFLNCLPQQAIQRQITLQSSVTSKKEEQMSHDNDIEEFRFQNRESIKESSPVQAQIKEASVEKEQHNEFNNMQQQHHSLREESFMSSQSNQSVFEKNSFQQQFQKEKVTKVFKAEVAIESMIQELNKALKNKLKQKKEKLNNNNYTQRTYDRKKEKLDKWVEKEKNEIEDTQKHFSYGVSKLSSILDHFVKDQSRIKEAVGQIRQNQSRHSSNKSLTSEFASRKRSQQLEESFTSQVQQNLVNIEKDHNSVLQQKPQQHNNDPLIELNDIIIEPLLAVDIIKQKENSPQNLNILEKEVKQEFEEIKKQNETNQQDQLAKIPSNIEIKEPKQIFEYQQQQRISENIFEPLIVEDIDIIENHLDGNIEKEDQRVSLEDVHLSIELNNKQTPREDNNDEADEKDVKQDSKQNQEQEKEDEEMSDIEIIIRDTPQNDYNLVESIVEMPIVASNNAEFNHDYPTSSNEEPLQTVQASKDNDEFDQQNLVSKALSQVDQIKSMEDLMDDTNGVNEKTDQLVGYILNDILIKELRYKLFPQRVIPGVNTQNCPNIEQHRSDTENKNKQDEIDATDDIKIELSEFPKSNTQLTSMEDDKLEAKKRQGIETNLSQVRIYMQEVFEKITLEKEALGAVLENISQPLYKDPLQILAHLQNTYYEPSENQPNYAIPYQQSVLSVDLYLDIEKERRGMSISKMKDSFEESNTQSFIAEMENIHNKAIFDAVNEAMDGLRPYGLRGPPLPWSNQSKTLTFKFGKEETVDFLLQKVKFRLLEWANMNAGMIGFEGMDERDKHQLEMMREDRLARILISEAEENEPLWVDYDYEETQTKLDLADLVLNQLCAETVGLLQDLKLKKIEDSNNLVIRNEDGEDVSDSIATYQNQLVENGISEEKIENGQDEQESRLAIKDAIVAVEKNSVIEQPKQDWEQQVSGFEVVVEEPMQIK